MSTGPQGPHLDEIAHDVEDLREDLAFERQTLEESVRHDYSTSETGIVPLDRRRPMWHFLGLWTTFVAGFSYMFLGFALHDGGHSLAATVGITAFGYALYISFTQWNLGEQLTPVWNGLDNYTSLLEDSRYRVLPALE